jgi:PST family polysaccharide transporter
MLFISTLISIYFLPKLSACRSGNEAKQYIKIYQQFILPVFAIGIVVFYIFRNQITTLFLDRSFLPLSDYLFWQLIGDFLKAFALIYGIMFYSYRLVLPYLITESISFLLFYGLSFYWISSEGITGVTKAHSVVYLVYSIILLIYFSRYFNKHFPQPDKL